MTEQQYNGFHCGYCNIPLQGSRRKWCCKKHHQYYYKPPFSRYPKPRDRTSLRTKAEDSAYRAQRSFERYKSHCLHCSAVFSRKLGNNSGDRANSYCSMDCRTRLRGKVRHERELYRDWSDKLKSDKAFKIKIIASIVKRLLLIRLKEEKKKLIASKPCIKCGSPVGYVFGRHRLYCSDDCSPSKGTEAKRASRKKRKALERGAKEGETVYPLKVFNRCGWKCQICSLFTPPKLRGKNKPNSPELDHIVPLSKGGAHSYANTQLLCRSCNGWKSNKLVAGQRLLFVD